jgi:membrane-associated phospholipid phosphatase
MKKVISYIKKERKFIISMCILFFGNAIFYWGTKLFQSNPIYINYYLDDKIPFWGWFIYIYNMFYPFSVLAFCLLYYKDEKTYYKGVISCIIGCIICYVIILLMPTIMYRPVTPNYDSFTNFVIKVTYFFDEPPLNCFPSLHCLFCFQVIISYIISKCTIKRKTWVIIFSSLIVISTLLVKQHFIYDVVAALLVCLLANLLESTLELYSKFKKKKII